MRNYFTLSYQKIRCPAHPGTAAHRKHRRMFRSFSGSSIVRGMRGKFRRAIGWRLFFAALVCGSAHAGTDGGIDAPRFSLGGFGTLGFARSTGGEGLLRDVSQPKGISHRWSAHTDSVFGLQASYRLDDSLDAVVQGASFLRYDGSYRPRLTWAFLKYELTPRFSLRAGRIGTEFFMMSNSRRIGYSYLPVRPRVNFYGINPFATADGVDAHLKWPVGEGIFRLEAFAGKSSEKVLSYDIDGSRLFRGMLEYDQGYWQFRYIHARGKLAGNTRGLEALHSALRAEGANRAADALTVKDTVNRYHSFGITYDDGRWQTLLAATRVTSESPLLENLRAVTLLVARRFGDFRPFFAYTWAKSASKTLDSGLPNPAFAAINDAITQTMAASHLHCHTRALGVRWDFARNMDFKVEIDFIRNSKSSVLLSEGNVSHGNGRTKVFSLSLDFMF